MATTVIVVKKKVLVKKPVVKIILEDPAPAPAPIIQQKSIWLTERRHPRIKSAEFVWEHIEDISEDEDDTPQAAGKRLSQMKATRDRMQRRAYEQKFDEYQCAGLFLGWSAPKFIKPHPWQDTPFNYIVTAPYPN